MTKSGIGTPGVQQILSNQTSTQHLTNNSSIGSAEIPIWVADRKKWVTGISKKTTINDLIYAILKQCQLVPETSQNESSSSQSIIEQIASQYVLTEYQYEQSNESNDPEFVLSSQRILEGDSKVYKCLPKWSQITNTNNLMLKILQRELVTDLNGVDNTTPVQNNNNSHHSLASKILKKIGVNSNSNLNKNLTVHSQSQQNMNTSSYRLVDVKLPSSKGVTQNLKSNESNNSETHRALLFNTIFDGENRLKKQKDKFSLLDELLRESEKKTKIVYESYNSLPNGYNQNVNTNLVDLNDIYCHFPEMCTHNINEVEDFTYMCCQLFKLDEAIQSQKQILNNLELDLQRELNNQNQFGTLLNQNLVTSDCPEIVELRKEVNNSREQTRIHCKQLHDLDLRMRQNEQNLMLKEQELNQLLEQLYVQEVYTENDSKTHNEHVSVNDITHEEFDRINLDHDETRHNFNDDMILTNNLISKSTNGMNGTASRSTNNLNTQLNNAHKSLSYGNLNAPVIHTSPNQVNHKSQIKPKMKTSPSMDINNKNLVINTNDQLGETDSGISSMSSETAVTTTTSSTSSSSSAQIINSNNSPNSIPINNLYFNGQKQVPTNHYQQQQFQYQRQYMQPQQVQQQPKQQQLPINNQSLGNNLTNAKQVKSVLETLV